MQKTELLLEREAPVPLCSTHVLLSPIEPFIELATSVPDDELHEFGRENEPHVTVLYGIKSEKSLDDVALICSDYHKIKLTLGKTSKFECPEYDVLKIDVHSPSMIELNKIITKNIPYTSDFPDYHPHCTVAYLKKGFADKYCNNDTFNGKEYTCNTVIFSPPENKMKTPLKLGQSNLVEYKKLVRLISF
jgi:2'-5' RNA ligase